jgi:hypothetical protein
VRGPILPIAATAWIAALLGAWLGPAAAAPAIAVPAVIAVHTDAVHFDLSPAEDLLAIWKRWHEASAQAKPSKRRRSEFPDAALRLGAGLPYRTLQRFLADQFQCELTNHDLVRALAEPDSGSCGVALHFPYRDRGNIDSLVHEIRTRAPELRASAAARAGEYLPPGAAQRPIRVWFLVATQFTFDAVTLRADADRDSSPVVLVNLSDVLTYAGSTRERVDGLAHVLSHETFHAALREIQPQSPGWSAFSGQPRDAFSYIAGIMLDEGVAHYIDWKQRPGADTLFAAKPCSRERFAFSQLGIACRKVSGGSMEGPERVETLELAANGPLWSKYAAMTGMFAAYRIERALGRDALIRAVIDGPPAFLRLYEQAALKDSELKPLPEELAAVK